MSKQLYQFLCEAYQTAGTAPSRKTAVMVPMQIDDQDDNDDITEFCTIFVTLNKDNRMEIELCGRIPLTSEIHDLCEIYGGTADSKRGRITLFCTPQQVDALVDLAAKLRKTAFMGRSIGNPNWHRISARSVSSLYRFVRIIKEYLRLQGASHPAIKAV